MVRDDKIIITCGEHSKLMYPRAGTFTPDEVRDTEYIKANFGGEHMWIIVDSITELGVNGTVDNDPVKPESPPCGSKVFISFSKIEDIILKD